ncbi:MAG: metal-dependent transcriptional regulator [Bacillota bacterium]|nr:metal-dependent transcriptional regulator [Bacillota bacterium]
MKQSTMGKTREDYLKAVLITEKKYGACRCVDVARYMGVSKSSTSSALKKLEQEGFIIKDDWRILLTEIGWETAVNVYQKYMFFLNWLKEIGVDENTAEDDACKIEHVISEESFIRICEFKKRL